ncbi:MAG TPA: diguanylate cyclase [Rhodopila sp.]|nr:diguanylate cyclase [Rhodopila sp.]
MTAKILVVDDLPANTRLLRAKLTAEYYQVSCASDGFEALALAYIWKPDLILLDVMMPGMDGYECCALLKAEEATAHIPVMMITALDEPEQRVSALGAGADELLTKPLDYDIFLARVRSLIPLKRMTDEWLIRSGKLDTLGFKWGAPIAPMDHLPRALVLTNGRGVDALPALLGENELMSAAVTDGVEAVSLASFLRFQLVVVDLLHSSDDALRLISMLRASSSNSDAPIVIVTTPARKAQTVAGFSLGASDCIVEPIDRNEFRIRIRNQLRKQFFRKALQADLGAVLEAALLDPLTGVHNRGYLTRYIERQPPGQVNVSVIMLDIDHFKQINDTLGHISGDQVIRAVAQTLKGNLRSVDVVIRYGGEEFAIFVPTRSVPEAKAVAERLRTAVEQLCVMGVSGEPIALTVSAGVAVAQDPLDSIEALIRFADEELYAAKRDGRNCVRVRGGRNREKQMQVLANEG